MSGAAVTGNFPVGSKSRVWGTNPALDKKVYVCKGRDQLKTMRPKGPLVCFSTMCFCIFSSIHQGSSVFLNVIYESVMNMLFSSLNYSHWGNFGIVRLIWNENSFQQEGVSSPRLLGCFRLEKVFSLKGSLLGCFGIILFENLCSI